MAKNLAAKAQMGNCWYCGARGIVELWTSEGESMPMCRFHAATTRAALALRSHGENATADALDDVVGIETRPEFAEWIDPFQRRARSNKRSES